MYRRCCRHSDKDLRSEVVARNTTSGCPCVRPPALSTSRLPSAEVVPPSVSNMSPKPRSTPGNSRGLQGTRPAGETAFDLIDLARETSDVADLGLLPESNSIPGAPPTFPNSCERLRRFRDVSHGSAAAKNRSVEQWCFADADEPFDIELADVPKLFCCAVTNQFLRFSDARKETQLEPRTDLCKPELWIDTYSGFRDCVVWMAALLTVPRAFRGWPRTKGPCSLPKDMPRLSTTCGSGSQWQHRRSCWGPLRSSCPAARAERPPQAGFQRARAQPGSPGLIKASPRTGPCSLALMPASAQ